MEPQSIISQVGYLFEKTAGIWFILWAVRHRFGLDYKLNGAALVVRWAVVFTGFALGLSLPGPPVVRAVSGFIAIAFLCYPNLAWQIMRRFTVWPAVLGHIVSVAETDDSRIVMYDFQCGDKRLGGTMYLKRSAAEYSQGQAILVQYDPLNPGESRIG